MAVFVCVALNLKHVTLTVIIWLIMICCMEIMNEMVALTLLHQCIMIHSIQPACVKESQHGSRSRCTDMCSHGCVGCVILSILKLFLTDTFVE